MGLGDVKLAAVMGFFLGRNVAPALLVALIAGSAVGLAMIGIPLLPSMRRSYAARRFAGVCCGKLRACGVEPLRERQRRRRGMCGGTNRGQQDGECSDKLHRFQSGLSVTGFSDFKGSGSGWSL